MKVFWQEEFEKQAVEFIKLHFGGWEGLTKCFPSLRDSYPWGDHRPAVLDSRIPARNNDEYHGLERHASQYHFTAQYEFAYHHWIIAANHRRQDMLANNFVDRGHQNALEYCLKQATYNQALYEWQDSKSTGKAPQPEMFGLKADDIAGKDEAALKEIENFRASRD